MKRFTTLQIACTNFPSIFLKGWIMICWLVVLHSCQSAPSTDVKDSQEPIDSLKFYSDMISESPRNDTALLNRADLLFRQGSYEAALKDLDRLLEADSLFQEAYLLKSRVELNYFQSGNALTTLRKAEQLWPSSYTIKETMAHTYLVLKQYEKAIEKAREALQISPMTGDPYLTLGMVATETGDSLAAIRYFKRAVQNDADLIDGWFQLARLQTEVSPEDAVTTFESALQIAPENPDLWHAFGLYWDQQGQLERAKACYEEIIRIDPGYIEAHFNRALILMDQDSFVQAITHWNHFIDREPEEARAWFYRGICHELTRDFPSALEDYIQGKNLDPDLPNIDQAIQSMQDSLR